MEPLPRSMIYLYLQRRSSEVVLLRKGLEENSISEFKRLGHQVKGNARTFGFIDLESIAIKMEQVSTSNLQELGPILIDDFLNCINKNIKDFDSQTLV
jgi:HPt (histidine-containing phosphotransfer) domain-containing protein